MYHVVPCTQCTMYGKHLPIMVEPWGILYTVYNVCQVHSHDGFTMGGYNVSQVHNNNG